MAAVPVRSYRDLRVWQQAMDLAETSLRFGGLLPRDERFGLISQIRRAAGAVPANIAEGYGREHLGDYLRFLSVANGSLMELETHVLLAVRLGFATREQAQSLFEQSGEVGRMLSRLISSLKVRRLQRQA